LVVQSVAVPTHAPAWHTKFVATVEYKPLPSPNPLENMGPPQIARAPHGLPSFC
jgi:hypothetical protein